MTLKIEIPITILTNNCTLKIFFPFKHLLYFLVKNPCANSVKKMFRLLNIFKIFLFPVLLLYRQTISTSSSYTLISQWRNFLETFSLNVVIIKNESSSLIFKIDCFVSYTTLLLIEQLSNFSKTNLKVTKDGH